MVGIVDANVENVKLIGRREMNMNGNMKGIFYESDYRSITGWRYKPYFNDAKELFEIPLWIHLRKTTDNKQKKV